LSKHPEGPQEDELHAQLPEGDVEKSSTVFARTDGKPHLWDYQIKGFFKQACLAMVESGLTAEALKKLGLGKWTYKRSIDLLVFVAPRRIFLQLPEGTDSQNLEYIERPLRKDNFKGGNVCLARSESAPAGTTCEFDIKYLNPKLEEPIKKWLEYGALSGIGQWRNSGMGRFSHEIIE
jgi:hypothetical protein